MFVHKNSLVQFIPFYRTSLIKILNAIREIIEPIVKYVGLFTKVTSLLFATYFVFNLVNYGNMLLFISFL